MGSSHLFAQSQKIIINELMAKNELDAQDEAGDHHDWVEFYNPGEQPQNLAGMFLTDDEQRPHKWMIPGHTEETIIPAKGHSVLFWTGIPRLVCCMATSSSAARANPCYFLM